MSYGLQISASGVFAALYRQDVYANNLANLDTPGFKVDVPTSRPRECVREEDGVWQLPSNRLLERLGAGALLNANSISFAQGSLKTTGNALDVGIQGDGFFMVQDGDATRLTRDGRFTRDAQGMLVLASGGQRVLGEDGKPIRLPAGAVTIDGEGTVRSNGQAVSRLGFVDVSDRGALTKAGHGMFAASEAALKGAVPATGRMTQYAIEESAVDEVAAIMQMTSASRDVEANTAMIREHDRLLDKAINTLGRVM
ncbi:MAG: flagellar basal body protein [Phycisphaerae bacterium]|nr:MAG: flagellar basal body protein [Phycisphaerae bacterium]